MYLTLIMKLLKINLNLSLPYIQISLVRGENHPSYGISLKIKLTRLYNNFIIIFYSNNDKIEMVDVNV